MIGALHVRVLKERPRHIILNDVLTDRRAQKQAQRETIGGLVNHSLKLGGFLSALGGSPESRFFSGTNYFSPSFWVVQAPPKMLKIRSCAPKRVPFFFSRATEVTEELIKVQAWHAPGLGFQSQQETQNNLEQVAVEGWIFRVHSFQPSVFFSRKPDPFPCNDGGLERSGCLERMGKCPLEFGQKPELVSLFRKPIPRAQLTRALVLSRDTFGNQSPEIWGGAGSLWEALF